MAKKSSNKVARPKAAAGKASKAVVRKEAATKANSARASAGKPKSAHAHGVTAKTGSAKKPKAKNAAAAEAPAVEQRPKQIKDISKLLDKDYTSYEMTGGKKPKNINIGKPEAVKNAINLLLDNEQIIDYLKKNVSRVAPEVISMLSTPRTDEYIAEQLGLKINAIRRILNILQGYGITNYYVAKNTNGWLSFAWFINVEKLDPFLEYVNRMGRGRSIINDECNDYFLCRKCYDADKVIFTVDSADESGFRCSSCGNALERIGKAEAEKLMKPAATKAESQDYAASSSYSGE